MDEIIFSNEIFGKGSELLPMGFKYGETKDGCFLNGKPIFKYNQQKANDIKHSIGLCEKKWIIK